MHDAAPRKVPEAEFPEPAALCPAPVRRYRVEEARHDGAEDDVAVEVAPLRDGAGDDGGAGGGESSLKRHWSLEMSISLSFVMVIGWWLEEVSSPLSAVYHC